MAEPAKILDSAGDAVRQAIRAYHGSPYDFNKFDASKIGTGEGAQAYGHGLYFAGNEAVAQDYRDRLRDLVDRPVPDELGDELQSTIKQIHALAKQRSAATGDEFYDIQQALDGLHQRHADIQHRIRAASYNPGHVYEVEIAYPERALLNLDSPATGAHRNALMASALEAPDNQWSRDALREIASGQTRAKVVTESLLRAYNTLNENKMTGRASAQKAVSDSLSRNGIPGAMYFDQGSRDAGEGTRNYVMFPGTEDSIRILRKYGILAPVAAGAAANNESP